MGGDTDFGWATDLLDDGQEFNKDLFDDSEDEVGDIWDKVLDHINESPVGGFWGDVLNGDVEAVVSAKKSKGKKKHTKGSRAATVELMNMLRHASKRIDAINQGRIMEKTSRKQKSLIRKDKRAERKEKRK